MFRLTNDLYCTFTVIVLQEVITCFYPRESEAVFVLCFFALKSFHRICHSFSAASFRQELRDDFIYPGFKVDASHKNSG